MRKYQEFEINENQAGLTVEEYLRTQAGYSGRYLQKLTRAKGINLNGKRVILAKKLKYKDNLKISILQEQTKINPQNEFIPEILYENENLLVANKPTGMLVHPAGHTKSGTLLNYLAAIYKNFPEVALHAVHRLDKNTSGCILIAKNIRAYKILDEQLRAGKIKRVYQAVVQGILVEQQGTIKCNINKDPLQPNRRIVDSTGQSALTHYCLRKHLSSNRHLLELELETGRTHQIRVHLAHIGLPILGDGMYGIKTKDINRQALHATSLSFINLNSGEKVLITSDLPEEIIKLLKSN